MEENWLLHDGVHLRVYAQPLPDGGLLLIFEDRTEHVQLASSRDTLLRVRNATLDNLFEAIAVFAADGRPASVEQQVPPDLVGAGSAADHPSARRRADGGALRSALAAPSRRASSTSSSARPPSSAVSAAARIAFADGRYFEFAAIPLPDGNALFVMLDISDSRRIEQALRDRNEALEDADRVKTAFVSNMSYELRTPLTSIVGFAEMMQGGLAGTLPEQAGDYVDAIIESTNKLAKLIDNVLDLTQGAAGGLPHRAQAHRDGTAGARDRFGLRGAREEQSVAITLALQASLGAIRAMSGGFASRSSISSRMRSIMSARRAGC